MKQKKDWLRKASKRKLKGKDRGIVDFMRICYHFFQELPMWISEMADPRNTSYTTYTQADYIYMGILKNVCSVESMSQMEEKFNEEECINTLRILSGDERLEEMPHKDSLNYYLMKLSPECLAGLRKKMIAKLLRNKTFHNHRLCGKYWRIILDGTGLFCFKEKHCENCLVSVKKTEDGKTIKRYYHKVLEAKLVLAPNLVLSIDTEFIENERENVGKQDCEVSAAKRLLVRLKKDFPRLPIVIQGDALYAAEPIMAICRKNGWRYLFTHKAERQPGLDEGFRWIEMWDGGTEVRNIGKECGTGMFINHVEEIAGKKETANLYRYKFKEKGKDGEEKEICYMWLTDILLTPKNLEEMIEAGRGRWKIENEGFNTQKNIIYQIEHLNSRDSNAMKNHYLLTQIADILMQLYLAWNPLLRTAGQTIKNTSQALLESFRRQTVTPEDVAYITTHTTVYLE